MDSEVKNEYSDKKSELQSVMSSETGRPRKENSSEVSTRYQKST